MFLGQEITSADYSLRKISCFLAWVDVGLMNNNHVVLNSPKLHLTKSKLGRTVDCRFNVSVRASTVDVSLNGKISNKK